MSRTPPVCEVIGDPAPFLRRLLAELEAVGIDVSGCFLDHLCYRVASQARYDQLKARLGEVGSLLHEAMIGGRPIATFKLAVAVRYGERRIDVIELPSPKPGRAYAEGLEHAEFVIGETFESFMARHPGVEFDASGADKAHNAELRVGFGEISAKFHHQSLEDVIARERAIR